MSDPLVEALRRLVDTKGGAIAVADLLEVNDQTIYQILKGIQLPSGRPKGVGPKLRKKLDQHFPGWASTAATPAPPALDQSLKVVLAALIALPALRWSAVRALLDEVAGRPENLNDALTELLMLLTAPPSKRQAAA